MQIQIFSFENVVCKMAPFYLSLNVLKKLTGKQICDRPDCGGHTGPMTI